MIRKVRDAGAIELALDRFPATRSADGLPSVADFIGGPLAAARFAFRAFDDLAIGVVSAVRSFTIVDPIFGPVVFVGVLVTDGVVDIVDFADDPDYWETLDDESW